MVKSSYQIAQIRGIPIRVHFTLLLLLPLYALSFSNRLGFFSLFWSLLTTAALFASVALHELGHSMVALSQGCGVREILLLPIGGIAQLERIPTRPLDEFFMAAAGPAVSFLLSAVFFLAGLGTAALRWIAPTEAFLALSGINLMLALFNLLPSFPMDGGRIFRAWLTPYVGRLKATRIAARTGRFMAVLFGIWAVWPPFNPFLLVIAFFIYQAAGAEYRMVMIQEARKNQWGSPWPGGRWTYDDASVHVSPPPYQRGGRFSSFFARPLRQQHDLFNELFEKWR